MYLLPAVEFDEAGSRVAFGGGVELNLMAHNQTRIDSVYTHIHSHTQIKHAKYIKTVWEFMTFRDRVRESKPEIQA